jgi:hypothetical protein
MTNGILAVWSGIDAEAEDDYNAWYEREHMFERVEVPGIRRARHYQTVSGTPKFFTYFELAEPAVVSSGVYLAQSDNSSPWTQRILPHFREVNRTASRVLRRLGRGFGGAAMTIRFVLVDGEDPPLTALLARNFLPQIIDRPGIIAAQLWQADRAASSQPGKDRELRPAEDAISDLTLFVEGTGITNLQALADDQQLATILGNANTMSPPLVAIHQLLNGAETQEALPI